MAKETMEQIRMAEMKADQTVKEARAQAEAILEDARSESASRIQEARMKAAATLHQAETAANEQAAAETARTGEETQKEVDALCALAKGKEKEAIQLVLDSLV